LANPGIYLSPNDPLRFEKAMLEDWFRRRFGNQRSAEAEQRRYERELPRL
jgi:hypothetical protein